MSDVDSPILIKTMQDLIRTIKDGSLAGGDFNGKAKLTNQQKLKAQNVDPVKEAADRQRIEKAMKEGTKALKDAFKSQENYGRDMKLAGSLFQVAVGKLSLKAYDELPKRINKLTQDIGLQFQTKADIDKALNRYSEQNIDVAKKLHADFLTLDAGTKKYNDTLTMMQKIWGEDISELARTKEELQHTGEELGKAIRKETLAIEQAARDTTTASKATAVFAEILGYVAYQMLDATKASAKFGVEITPLALDMKKLGMSADELGEIQNKNIQAIRGAGISFGDFDKMLISGAYDLAAFTGSMKDGAIIFGDAFRNFRMLSSQTKNQNQFITDTAKAYKFMHETVGTTAQQFQELTQQLMNNNEVQINMYRLNERQRTQAFLELIQQDALLKTYGLLEPEAQAVVHTFAQIGAQGPKERLKQAAQLTAVGGALGLGNQARQLAELIRHGDTQTPEAVKLAREIQQAAQKQYANVKGTAGEFAQYALTNLPGVQQILGQAGPVAALATRQGAATPTAVAQEAKNKAEGKLSKDDQLRQTAVTTIVTISDQVKGISTLLTVIATTLAIPTLTNIFKKGIGGGLGRLLGRGGGALAGEGILAGEGAAAAGAVGGGGLAAAAGTVSTLAAVGLASYGITTLVTDTIPKMLGAKQGLGEAIGGAIADHFGPQVTENKSPEAQKRASIVSAMIKDRSLLEKGNLDDKRQNEVLDQLDMLTSELAKMNGKDPAKAVEDLHKTLKTQHQENKQMTQEQTDAIQKNKAIKEVKTSQRLGTTS